MEQDQRGGHCYALIRDSSVSLVYGAGLGGCRTRDNDRDRQGLTSEGYKR